jgi:hypothetical protein
MMHNHAAHNNSIEAVDTPTGIYMRISLRVNIERVVLETSYHRIFE